MELCVGSSVFIEVLFHSSRRTGLQASPRCRSWDRTSLMVASAVASDLELARVVKLAVEVDLQAGDTERSPVVLRLPSPLCSKRLLRIGIPCLF